MSEHLLTAAEEKVAIRGFSEAAELQIKEGDKIYLLCFRWWKQWAAYVSEEVVEPLTTHNSKLCSKAEPFSGRPTSIDNSHLVNRSTIDDYAMELELKEALKENYDYILLPEQVWMAFHKWYGGGPVIARQVINTGSVCEDSLEVEIYPLRLCLIASPSRNRLITRMSRMATVGELYQKACDLFDLGSEQIRIWDYNGGRKNFLLSDLQQALADLKLQMDHDILLEVQVNGRWPDDHESFGRDHGCLMNDLPLVAVEPLRSSFSIADGPTGSRNFISSSPELVDSHSLSYSSKSLDGGLGCFSSGGARPGPLGLTGLQNLGNTCFMSSAIQCLAHTPQLVDFFVQDYSQEINQQNPLGMEGELAMAFGDLLRKLWADGRTPVAPRAFKAKLARFAPQFSGYNQHDSQELLAFLLDGLHEDLNRVKLKPYIESKNIDGRSDDEVAREYWDNHKARNDSIIVDTYQGQYKSTLVCPLCNKVSVTFDPFMYLSLPLPSATTRTITVTIFSSDGISPPTPCTVTVSRHARCKDVIHALSKACHLHNDERLLLMELYNPRSYRFLDEFMEWLSTIHDDAHLTAYRLAKSLEKAPLLIFINRRFEKDVTLFQDDQQLKYFGAPLFASLPDEGLHTGADLLMIFERLLGPLIKNQQSLITKHKEKELQNGMTNYIDDIMEVKNKEETSVSNGTLKSIILNLQKSTPDGSNSPLEHCEELFQLFLTEEKGLTKESLIVVEKPLPPAFGSYRVNSKLHVTVEWSKKALEIYDIKQLEALPEVHKSGFPSKKVRQETVSLYACLEAFLKEEPLGPEDMWYCPCCKQHRQASKKLDLWRLPAILVVHLKRFSYSRFSKNKLETFVEFPIHDLDLTNYIACKDDPQSYVYELYAVSNHYGNMGGGHYTAYAKLIDDNRWYNFDDSHVSPVSEDEIKTAAAYVLFYRRTRTGNSSLSAGGPCWSSTRILETRNDEAG